MKQRIVTAAAVVLGTALAMLPCISWAIGNIAG
jgi:hypothetical protein